MSNLMTKEEAAEFAKNFRSDDDDIQEYARPCPNCEYHRQRAQLWREEAYKQAGHPLPERGWVGLTDEEMLTLEETTTCTKDESWLRNLTRAIEAKLKEKNERTI